VLVKEQRMQRLPIGKGPGARLASRRPGLDVPFVHGRGNLTTKAADEHEEIFGTDFPSRNPRLARRKFSLKILLAIAGFV
jgi:hypothetical protein